MSRFVYTKPIYIGYISTYPNVLREELTDQIVSLRKKFVTYEDYSEITIEDIFSTEQLERAPKKITNFLETVWFENNNGKFTLRHLPPQANFSSVNAILVEDLDGDGNKDLLLGGNTKFNRVRIGECDASYGIFLRGDGNGSFKFVPNREANINFKGIVRSIQMVKSKKNKKLVVGINNSKPLVINLKKNE